MEPTRERGYSYALWLLGRREYSHAKLRAKLVEKGYEEHAESLLIELAEKGYLREEAYTEGRVRGWIRKGYAESHILRRARMEKLAVTPERVHELYAELGTDESAQVRALLKKKLRRAGPTGLGQDAAADAREEERRRRRSLALYVARKGHDFGRIASEIDRLGEGDGSNLPAEGDVPGETPGR